MDKVSGSKLNREKWSPFADGGSGVEWVVCARRHPWMFGRGDC